MLIILKAVLSENRALESLALSPFLRATERYVFSRLTRNRTRKIIEKRAADQCTH